jgi:cell wall-associated NlpC family hydrolase
MMNKNLIFNTLGFIFLLTIFLLLPIVGHACETDDEAGTFSISLSDYTKGKIQNGIYSFVISYEYLENKKYKNETSPAKNTVLTVTSSEEFEFIDFYDKKLNKLYFDIYSKQDTRKQVDIQLDQIIKYGNKEKIIVVIRMNDELSSSKNTLICGAKINADNVNEESTKCIKLMATTDPINWKIDIFKKSLNLNSLSDNEITYGIKLSKSSCKNKTNLRNINIEIDYPINSIVTYCEDGIVDTGLHKIIWKERRLRFDENIYKRFTIYYPGASISSEKRSQIKKINNAKVAAEVTGNIEDTNSIIIAYDEFEHTIDGTEENPDIYNYFEYFDEEGIYISDKRKIIVEKAMSLRGSVGYFWNGKSTNHGIDPKWGTEKTCKYHNKKEPFGLDCSGYVEWVFANSGFDFSEKSKHGIGRGTKNQWIRTHEIAYDDALPGDLAFKQPPTSSGINHVGIIVGRDDEKQLMVVNCSSAESTVVITPYSEVFRYIRRPNVLFD